MSRVFFDPQVFAEQSRGGVSRYFLNLAGAILTYSDWSSHVALGFHVQSEIPGNVQKWGPRLRLSFGGRGLRFRRELNRISVMRIRPGNDGETIYHPTWYHAPTVRAWRHLPLVVTVHDLIPEQWPIITDAQQLADRADIFKMARSIVCVSESTRMELARHYPVVVSRASTALPGLPALPKGRRERSPSGDYVVHVGERGAYKDFGTVLRAMSRLPSLSLIVLGGGPQRDWEKALMSELGIERQVVFESNVDDQRLADVVSGAVALVSASRAEGFGLPPIEAAAEGIPSVLADIPPYRELHWRWATFFPPGDESGLAEALDLVSRGRHVVLPSAAEIGAMFSWDQAVSDVVAAYDRALS